MARCHLRMRTATSSSAPRTSRIQRRARATMGCSAGGSAALIMAWYHPEWYHRVLTYSGTYVNQQWPHDDATPGGAWEFHRTLIPNSAAKPIRVWLEVGDRDLLNPNVM